MSAKMQETLFISFVLTVTSCVLAQPPSPTLPITIPRCPPCGPHEICRHCGTACEPSCDEPSPQACILICKLNVCQCEKGYVRNGQGRCVRPCECRDPCVCGVNEELVRCGCEASCDNPIPNCPKVLCRLDAPLKCQCASGYLRNKEGVCVRKELCNAPIHNPCAVVRCRAGYHCIPVASPCSHPPCPLRAECVKDCCPLECPPGQHCELQPVVCVRAPCPPQPTCVKNDHSSPWDSVAEVDRAKAIDVTDELIDADPEAVKSSDSE